jgi:hypothetical protein
MNVWAVLSVHPNSRFSHGSQLPCPAIGFGLGKPAADFDDVLDRALAKIADRDRVLAQGSGAVTLLDVWGGGTYKHSR